VVDINEPGLFSISPANYSTSYAHKYTNTPKSGLMKVVIWEIDGCRHLLQTAPSAGDADNGNACTRPLHRSRLRATQVVFL